MNRNKISWPRRTKDLRGEQSTRDFILSLRVRGYPVMTETLGISIERAYKLHEYYKVERQANLSPDRELYSKDTISYLENLRTLLTKMQKRLHYTTWGWFRRWLFTEEGQEYLDCLDKMLRTPIWYYNNEI